jgi:hypothetical protein
MAQYHSPRIVTDSLVLILDAGNNKSHSTNRFNSYGSGLVTEGVGFAVNGDGTFLRVAAGTVIGGYTVKTTDVVYSYALGSNGCHYHGNDVAMPAGVYATFSFDYLVTGATNYPSTDFLANFEGGFSNSIGTANNLQDVWQRRTFTSGPSGSAASLRMVLYPGACGGRLADSGTLYFRNPRVEWSNVDTGTKNFSSMPNTTTWYDMSGKGNNGTLTNIPYFFIGNTSTGSNGYISFDGTNDYVTATSSDFAFGTADFTVEGWAYVTSHINYRILATTRPDNGGYADAWHIGCDANGTIVLYSNASNLQSASNAVPTNQWFHWCCTRSNSSASLLINKNIVASGTVTNNYTRTVLGIGNFPVTISEPWSGYISNIRIYKNRALTVAEISQNFNALRGRFGI